MLWSFRLQQIRRYAGQPFWSSETSDAHYADRLENGIRLETVAEHSWNVADSVMLLGWRFPELNVPHAVELAVIHDKMEIEIGDWNPLGRDGSGDRGHAFSAQRAQSKDEVERLAIEAYVARLEPENRAGQRALLIEALECRSPEARFAKALDKMNALAFILLKKNGVLEERHVHFLLRFTYANNRFFPPLMAHSDELLRRNLVAYCRVTGSSPKKVRNLIQGDLQLDLVFDPPGGEVTDQAKRSSGEVPSKGERLTELFRELGNLPLARTGIEAQAQIANTLNRIEDRYWKEWAPPRFYPPGATTDRLYPIGADSIYPVSGWCVDVLVAADEHIYISAGGAIEVRSKVRRSDGRLMTRPSDGPVLFERADANGLNVWDHRWQR